MRVIFIIPLLFLICSQGLAQIITPKPKVITTTSPPSPPPPPPPPNGTGGTAGSGTSGLRLLKIPVTGPYYLGMGRREFDSLKAIAPVSIKTEKGSYNIIPQEDYSDHSIIHFRLQLSENQFSSDLSDLIAYYEHKLGAPDASKLNDTLRLFPIATDSSLTGEYRVKKTSLTWHFQYHDVVLSMQLTDLGNGNWKGNCNIRYAGSPLFREMLRQKADREGY